jgi:hypothetical protein
MAAPNAWLRRQILFAPRVPSIPSLLGLKLHPGRPGVSPKSSIRISMTLFFPNRVVEFDCGQFPRIDHLIGLS